MQSLFPIHYPAEETKENITWQVINHGELSAVVSIIVINSAYEITNPRSLIINTFIIYNIFKSIFYLINATFLLKKLLWFILFVIFSPFGQFKVFICMLL